MIKEHTHRLFLSVILFPYLSISSLLWTVCPCFYLKIQGISEQEESYAVLFVCIIVCMTVNIFSCLYFYLSFSFLICQFLRSYGQFVLVIDMSVENNARACRIFSSYSLVLMNIIHYKNTKQH